MGKPLFKFHPYHFGEPYRKQTWLWGKFNIPYKGPQVDPVGVNKGKPDDWYNKKGGKSEKTKEYRSITPLGFSRAFYEANH